MERWVAKVISIIVSFFLPLICNLIPYPLAGYIEKKGDTGKLIISRLLCFGGGIFFGTYLLHIAPEARDTLDQYLLIPDNISYPLTDLIIGLGFFFVLFMDKTIMKIAKRKNQVEDIEDIAMESPNLSGDYPLTSSENISDGDPLSIATISDVITGDTKPTFFSKSISSPTPSSSSDNHHHDQEDDHGHHNVENVEEIPRKSPNLSGDYQLSSSDNIKGGDPLSIATISDVITGDTKPSLLSKSTSSSSSSSSSDNHHHDHGDGHGHHNVRSLVLIMALSFHHFFEGLSLGLQETVSGVFTLLIALMCHETVISFSLGMQFVKCNYSLKRFILTSIAVCSIEPIGIAVGTIMTEVGSDSTGMQIADGVMQALASGSFLFVTFFEILPDQIHPHDTSLSKIAFVFCGFIAMALLQLIPDSTVDINFDTTSSDIFLNYTTSAFTTV